MLKVSKRSFVSVTRDARFQGIALWFETGFTPKDDHGAALLGKEVVLKTGPFDSPTHWKQTVLVLPKREPDPEQTGGKVFETIIF